jgi:hypothetical protein
MIRALLNLSGGITGQVPALLGRPAEWGLLTEGDPVGHPLRADASSGE